MPAKHRQLSGSVLACGTVERSSWPGRVFRAGERPPDDDVVPGTVAERLAMMWPLAVDAWAMRGEAVVESRFRRDVARVIRRRRRISRRRRIRDGRARRSPRNG